ncbi:hypothetical protein [Flavobacterium endophyticum]|uniref:hypothetical protein n=1 Tax=Flavobacterium endophyticum TaxID=1540163 RepID=UPI0014745927|nr:hypothetical protein [Flavobacterium endophyticum]
MEELGLFYADAVSPGLGSDALDAIGAGSKALVLSSRFIVHIDAGDTVHVDPLDLLAVNGKCRDRGIFKGFQLGILSLHINPSSCRTEAVQDTVDAGACRSHPGGIFYDRYFSHGLAGGVIGVTQQQFLVIVIDARKLEGANIADGWRWIAASGTAGKGCREVVLRTCGRLGNVKYILVPFVVVDSKSSRRKIGGIIMIDDF